MYACVQCIHMYTYACTRKQVNEKVAKFCLLCQWFGMASERAIVFVTIHLTLEIGALTKPRAH